MHLAFNVKEFVVPALVFPERLVMESKGGRVAVGCAS